MTALAWLSLAFVGYTYAGYALLLRFLRPRRNTPVEAHRPVAAGTGPSALDPRPSFTILIAACNEAANMGRKLDNLLAMDYPAGAFEVLVGSDGSTDGTDEIVRGSSASRVRLFRF